MVETSSSLILLSWTKINIFNAAGSLSIETQHLYCLIFEEREPQQKATKEHSTMSPVDCSHNKLSLLAIHPKDGSMLQWDDAWSHWLLLSKCRADLLVMLASWARGRASPLLWDLHLVLLSH